MIRKIIIICAVIMYLVMATFLGSMIWWGIAEQEYGAAGGGLFFLSFLTIGALLIYVSFEDMELK